MRIIDQNRATYLRGLEGFESTFCTVGVSTWRLLADEPACTELALWILDDDDDGCGESDITLLRASGDGVTPLPCVGWCEDGVRLGGWDNVGEGSSATGSCGVIRDICTRSSSVALFVEETLAVLGQQPMVLKSEEKL